MKAFHCDECGHLVFFENTRCLHCGHSLGYLPHAAQMVALDRADEGLWHRPATTADDARYRQCSNYIDHQVCNWVFPTTDVGRQCRSCELTRTIPDLNAVDHRVAWFRLEAAKRRLVYTLMRLGLPIISKRTDPESGLAFDFLAGGADHDPVLTGHSNGVITVNIAEADDVERERRRTTLHEPYRTLLGHFRHESGHYYWERLVRGTDRLLVFRTLFGDDGIPYADAIATHYRQGPPANWEEQFISGYAASHPWEDWAESWAHYLHMVDTLETAAACGLAVQPRQANEPSVQHVPPVGDSFDDLIKAWHPVTYVLNSLNRGLGLPDAYPFVLSGMVIDKLRFVHETVLSAVPCPNRSTTPN